MVEHADVAFRYETARIRIVALFIVGRSWGAVVGGIQIINGNLEKEAIGSKYGIEVVDWSQNGILKKVRVRMVNEAQYSGGH